MTVGSSLSRARAYVAEAFVLIAIVLSTFQKILDPDVFWHIRGGRWIWEHRALPSTDPFSYASTGHWIYSDWLPGLAFFAGDRLGGPYGLELVTAVLTLSVGVVILFACRESVRAAVGEVSPSTMHVVSTLVLGLWGAAVRFRLGPKADLFSFLGFALVLWLLRREARGRRTSLVTWFVLFAVWGNCHRAGLLGVGVIAAACIGASRQDPSRSRALAWAVLVSLVGVCMNPAGLHALTSVFDVTTRATFRAEFPEWASMEPRFPFVVDPPFGALVIAAMAGALLRRRLGTFECVAFAAVGLAVHSVRLVPFAAAALAVVVAESLGAVTPWVTTRAGGRVRPAVARVAASVAAVAVIASQYAQLPPSAVGLGWMWWRLPIQASRFLARFPAPGRIWNSFNFGGYLLYALGPAQKVIIDGRNDTAYSSAHFEETVRAGRDPDAFRAEKARFGFTTVVLECSQLACTKMPWVVRNPDWALVYMDDRALILVHREERTRAYIERHAYHVLRGTDDAARVAHLSTDPRAAELEADVIRYATEAPYSMRAQYLAAVVGRAQGRPVAYAEASARFEALATERGATLSPP